MLTLIATIILCGSLIGMATIVVRKIPALKLLPVEQAILPEKEKTISPENLKIAKEILKIIWLFLENSVRELFSHLRKLVSKKISFKEEEKPKLSEDYWKKIKGGK